MYELQNVLFILLIWGVFQFISDAKCTVPHFDRNVNIFQIILQLKF